MSLPCLWLSLSFYLSCSHSLSVSLCILYLSLFLNVIDLIFFRKFLVHKNILAARSPVFADLLARMDLCSPGGGCDAAATAAVTAAVTVDPNNPEKLVPIHESSHSNTSRDIRLLEDLDMVRKLDNIQETEGRLFWFIRLFWAAAGPDGKTDGQTGITQVWSRY